MNYAGGGRCDFRVGKNGGAHHPVRFRRRRFSRAFWRVTRDMIFSAFRAASFTFRQRYYSLGARRRMTRCCASDGCAFVSARKPDDLLLHKIQAIGVVPIPRTHKICDIKNFWTKCWSNLTILVFLKSWDRDLSKFGKTKLRRDPNLVKIENLGLGLRIQNLDLS